MGETGPLPPDESDLSSQADLEQRLRHVGVYEREGEIYRAHQIRGPDDGPASADFIVRRDSDGRYGGYVVDLARDGGDEVFGPEDLRYEAYDDAGRYIASTASLPGALSIFAQPARVRWISDRLPEHPDQPEPEAG
jgi:hypothetical protein